VASYDASINVRVTGTGMVDGVLNRVQELERLVKDINTRPINLARVAGRGDLADRFGAASRELNNLKNSFINSDRAVEAFGTTTNRTIANTTALASTFKRIADNSDIASAQFREFTVAAQQAAVAANTLGRTRLATLAEELSFGGEGGRTIGGGALVKELLQQEAAIPNSIAALNAYQGELNDLRQLVDVTSNEFRELDIAMSRIQRRMDIAQGRGPVQGPAAPPRLPGRGQTQGLASEASLNAILGGAFPALFGAGPGAIFGGFAGGAIGGAMGGLGGMALSVGLSAVGQQIDTIIAATQKLGNDTRLLNVDALRDSTLRVNKELATTVRLLTEAGKTAEARVAIEKEITDQTGASGDAQRQITEEVNRLQNSWNEFLGVVKQFAGIIGGPFISGLAEILTLTTIILKPINAGLSFLLRTAGAVEVITEEEEKRAAALETTSDAQLREMQHNKKLIDLEKQRTLGRTIAEKQLNNELDKLNEIENINKKAREEKKKFLTENAGLDKASLDLGIKNIDILKKQEIAQLNIKTNLQAQAYAYEKIQMQQELQLANAEATLLPIQAATLEIQKQQNALETRASVSSAFYQAENALLGLQQQQLQREYELATTRGQRLQIAERLFQVAVKLAETEYQQAIKNINLDTQRLQLRLQMEQLKIREIEQEASLQRLKVAGELEDTKRNAALVRINTELKQSLDNQNLVITGVEEQLQAQQKVAQYQAITAGAQLQSKVLTAQQQYEQKLVSQEIGFTVNKAAQMSGALVNNVNLTNTLASGMARVTSNAVAAANAITSVNIARATAAAASTPTAGMKSTSTGNVYQATYKYADGSTGSAYIKAHYAQGGYVNRPTNAVIGEGGQGEYVVPESKAAAFAMNYMLGARGAGAIDGNAAPPAINITTGPVMQQGGQNYVTIQDMEAGLQAVADTILNNSRSYSARRFAGVS